jgi:hypothetical protein
MKNAAIILLSISVGVLGLIAYLQFATLSQQQRQVHELTAKLDSTKQSASFEFQEKCAKQAKEYLSQFDNHDVVESLNHYNAKLNKCFVETRSESFSNGYPHSETKILTDAFEGKDYGEYIFISTPNKPDYLGSPAECEVTLPSGEETTCHSSDEFDALVKQYME